MFSIIGKNYSHPDWYILKKNNSTADQNYSSQLSVFPTSNICMEELMGGKISSLHGIQHLHRYYTGRKALQSSRQSLLQHSEFQTLECISTTWKDHRGKADYNQKNLSIYFLPALSQLSLNYISSHIEYMIQQSNMLLYAAQHYWYDVWHSMKKLINVILQS